MAAVVANPGGVTRGVIETCTRRDLRPSRNDDGTTVRRNLLLVCR
jgi:hypothetical protein